MSLRLLLSIAFLLCSGGVMAGPPRLGLWLTETLDATGAQHCHLSADESLRPLPAGVPILTERDVILWQPDSASLTLDPAHFRRADAARLIDRCFILALDGKIAGSGVLLSEHSARLIRFPVITVAASKGALKLQLYREFRGRGSPPLHIGMMDDILAEKRDGADSQDSEECR